MTHYLTSNLDIIFFFYGLAFIGLGLIIFSQLRGAKRSTFLLVGVLPILAWFGLTHGTHEMLEMFGILKGESRILRVPSVFMVMFSYVLLLYFGYSLFNLGERKKLGIWLPSLVLLLFFGVPMLFGPNSLEIWGISGRYFLGFGGSVLSAIGLQRYYRAEIVQIRELRAGVYFSAASASFILYAVAGGLIGSEAGFFPASVFNKVSFLSLVGLPVQTFRALAAIGLSWSFWHILNIFNVEQEEQRKRDENKLREARDNLEERVEVRTAELANVNLQLGEEIGRRKEVERSLRTIADTLQEALLRVPESIQGVDVGHIYQSSASEEGKAGGDFYDLFELGHESLGIIIGDVSGKGLEAATLTSLVKHSIQAYAYQYSSPAKIMSLANEVVCSNTSVSGVFVTVFFGVLDRRSGTLVYCSAGHPPGILRGITGDTLLLKTRSPVIGIFPSSRFKDQHVTMRHGEMLVLYTDGVTEARCEGDFYGEDRLVRLVRGSGTTNTKEMPQRILEEVSGFCEGSLKDDLAILTISFLGTTPVQSKRAN